MTEIYLRFDWIHSNMTEIYLRFEMPIATRMTRSRYTCAGRSCMGYSVLSVPLQMRYTEWVAFDQKSATPDFGTALAPPELYDHRTDLQENRNAAKEPANAAARCDVRCVLLDGRFG
jgi:hypothetical protein